MTIASDVTEIARALARHGQEHLLDGIDELPAETRAVFLQRLGAVDWSELERPAEPPAAGDVVPSGVVTLDERRRRSDELVRLGERALAAGRVGVLVVAGGQGTRLGFPGPKGCFPLAPLSGKTIYELQAEKVVALSRRLGRTVPLLVMTSPATDTETREFFASHGRFGLAPDGLRTFVQGTVPSLDREGRALLAEPGVLLENPDGQGGVFTALVASGNLDPLRDEGVEHLIYLQVDNVLAPVDDSLLVGLAIEERADVVTKVLEKAHPDERVGHLVRVGDRDRIVEYTELTPEDTRARGADGELLYRWGSPAMHLWSVAFLARLAESGFRLPLHRSAKPLQAWVDGEMREIDGWKHERFVFDLVPEAERSVGLEIERELEFAPVKNAEGDDSPATAIALMERQHVSWLRAAGVEVEPGSRIEVGPRFAATREQFLERWDGRVDRVTGDFLLDA